jgi:uncharacterized protein YgiM (DUF1202 family)
LKITAGAIVVIFLLWVAASVFIPTVADPEQRLIHLAKKIAAGPMSAEQAESMRKDFSEATKNYLQTVGNKSDAELVTKLQKIFPSSAFEVHVVDLPRGLKVVEIDTVLQANGYLLMKMASTQKVFPLTGLSVFDDARVINESAGPMLVLLGHTDGQPPHKPQVKVYALLPDGISDETDKLLPPLVGDGSVRFAANGRDIVLDLSLLSLGQSEHLFKQENQSEDGTVHQDLEWKDARYTSRYEYGNGPFAALYAVARCLRYPDLTAAHKPLLGHAGTDLVRNYKSPQAGEFVVKQVSSRGNKIVYNLAGSVGSFDVAIAKDGGIWSVTSAKEVAAGSQETVAASPVAPVQASAAPATKTANIVEQTPTGLAHLTGKHEEAVSASGRSQPAAKPSATHEAKSLYGTHAEISNTLPVDSVNMRKGPDTNAKTLEQLPKGAHVVIIGEENGWYRVRAHGTIGYVYSTLVNTQGTEQAAAPAPAKTSIASQTRTEPRAESRRHVATSPAVTASAPVGKHRVAKLSNVNTAPVKPVSHVAAAKANPAPAPAPASNDEPPEVP